ncbi:MAG TPA: DUF2023 family protein [Kiritimatiellia bacterium]|nr:DUF2023 family protein [Kiritimatiellia bacterium]
MDVFYHLLYEHSRGLRDLALYTVSEEQRGLVEAELIHEGVSYLFRRLEDGRVNVYFGHSACVDVVRSFGECPHCRLTPEQDFMLGIMLGYDRTRQCERYLGRRKQCLEVLGPCSSLDPGATCIREPDDEHALN